MCLTVPMQIKENKGDCAIAIYNGKEMELKIPFTPDLVVGDWVLVNADLALKKISAREAEEITNYYAGK